MLEPQHRRSSNVTVSMNSPAFCLPATPVQIPLADPNPRPKILVTRVPVESGGEAQGRSFVVLVGIPLDPEGVDAREDFVAKGAGDVGLEGAEVHVDNKGVGCWVAQVGGPIHGVCFAVEPLAGHEEGFPGGFGVLVELDGAVLVRVDCEDEEVDLVAEFGGELFEQWTVELGVDWSRRADHGRCRWDGRVSCLGWLRGLSCGVW